LCNAFFVFLKSYFCLKEMISIMFELLYSIRSIWNDFRISGFVASILCSAPTIFHAVRTILELCNVFFFVFLKSYFCFIGMILDYI
jgi:hypothetical protein